MQPGDGRLFTRPILGWCLYDWANSAFPTVVSTFVFAAYFTKAVAPDETTGTFLWGNATAIAAVCIALLSPALGAVADRTGRRKPWLAAFTLISVLATAALWTVEPDSSFILRALTLVIIATIGALLRKPEKIATGGQSRARPPRSLSVV